MISNDLDLVISHLGSRERLSPLRLSTERNDQIADFTRDEERIRLDPTVGAPDGPSFEVAGPRRMIHFDGANSCAGIVTCGGLCPGMNNVVRQLVLTLWHHYHVRRILGFRYGFGGMVSDTSTPPIALTPELVREIHLQGGTTLGSSRGPESAERIVENLICLGIDMVFVIGGDGGMRGTQAIYQAINQRGAHISVVGVPKTIDNDLPHIERTFGYDTAVSVATQAILAAHVEATGAPNGIGLVRLMGRHSGFIAAAATLASREVNLVLVPELPFALEGERGVFSWLKTRLATRGHAVIVVAEGAGQEYVAQGGARDPSGNLLLGDIGLFLKHALLSQFADANVNLKYIDPSYIIRAAPANPADAIFCGRLAEDAVHAAMAGKTGMVVGLWLDRFTHVPLHTVTEERKTISLDSAFWRSVVSSTGQPPVMR